MTSVQLLFKFSVSTIRKQLLEITWLKLRTSSSSLELCRRSPTTWMRFPPREALSSTNTASGTSSGRKKLRHLSRTSWVRVPISRTSTLRNARPSMLPMTKKSLITTCAMLWTDIHISIEKYSMELPHVRLIYRTLTRRLNSSTRSRIKLTDRKSTMNWDGSRSALTRLSRNSTPL
jgi:hypothetical protein